jgi:hypothetical protein
MLRYLVEFAVIIIVVAASTSDSPSVFSDDGAALESNGLAAPIIVAQYNPCPNGRCR